MVHKLTDRLLVSRRAPSKGRQIYTDAVMPGLAFRVGAGTKSNPDGRRDWLLRYRPRCQPQKAVSLGSYPAVSLSEARRRAGEIIAAAKRGVDLIDVEDSEAEARRAADAKARPLSEVAAGYLDGVKAHLRSWKQIELRIRRHIDPRFGNTPIGEISRAKIVEFLDDLERKKGLHHQVNRCRETLRAIFAYAVERELIEINPTTGVSFREEVPRDRTLTNDELVAFWEAFNVFPQIPRAYFTVLLLTGARLNEVRKMVRSELDLDNGLWRLPASRNKSNRAFDSPLSPPVVDALRGLPELGPMVFSLNGKGPLALNSYIEKIRRDAGLVDFRLHDLRRTLRTGMAELGVRFEVAERVLNHAMPGLQAVYNRHNYLAEKREALTLWADHVQNLVDGKGNTIVPFRLPAA
jgi:integrase